MKPILPHGDATKFGIGTANSADPDQTTPPGAIWSLSELFALFYFVQLIYN